MNRNGVLVLLAGTLAKFVSVGAINTAIDFFIYNVLTTKTFHLGRISANFISTTIAMIFSFFANKHLVFGSNGGNLWVQIIGFYLVTAFGVYVLQNIVIYLLSSRYKQPAAIVNKLSKYLHLDHYLSTDFVSKNTAKLAATVVSLSWNFILYKKVVFRT
ncbi:MAG: GtrA family protein [Candidatus Saccharimonadia bacterium]